MTCLGLEAGQQDGSSKQIHWAMAAPPKINVTTTIVLNGWSSLNQSECFYSIKYDQNMFITLAPEDTIIWNRTGSKSCKSWPSELHFWLKRNKNKNSFALK